MRRIIVAAVAAGSLALSLGACGSNSGTQESVEQAAATQNATAVANETAQQGEPAANATEAAVNATAGAESVLDSDAVLDIVFGVCPLSSSQVEHINVANKNGAYKVTFESEYGDFSYTVDESTGEITKRIEPEIPAGGAEVDPAEAAINACLEEVGCRGDEAQGIKVKFKGSQNKVAVVEFDYNGEHYEMEYDTESGTVTRQ